MGDEAPHPLPSYLATLARHGGSVLAGYLLAKGIITAAQAAELAGAAVAVVSILWGIIATHGKHKKLKEAIAAPEGYAK